MFARNNKVPDVPNEAVRAVLPNYYLAFRMKQLLAKILLTLACLPLSVGGWYFDAVRRPPTHLFNPNWPPHARYHDACWLFAISLAVLGAWWLLWGTHEARGSRLAVRGAAFLPGLFYAAFLLALVVPGVTPWNDGETPTQPVAPQVIMAVVALLGLVAGLVLDEWGRRATTTA